MNGKIEFDSMKDMVEFLALFTGQTAIFEAKKVAGVWTIFFKGGF